MSEQVAEIRLSVVAKPTTGRERLDAALALGTPRVTVRREDLRHELAYLEEGARLSNAAWVRERDRATAAESQAASHERGCRLEHDRHADALVRIYALQRELAWAIGGAIVLAVGLGLDMAFRR